MSDYLQRLLDRAAGTTTTITPAGLSGSPLVLHDQRLNDPQFSEGLAPAADNPAWTDVFALAEPITASSPALPTGPPGQLRPKPAHDGPAGEPPNPRPLHSPTPAEAQTIARLAPEHLPAEPLHLSSHPSPIGRISALDLVRPEQPATPQATAPPASTAAVETPGPKPTLTALSPGLASSQHPDPAAPVSSQRPRVRPPMERLVPADRSPERNGQAQAPVATPGTSTPLGTAAGAARRLGDIVPPEPLVPALPEPAVPLERSQVRALTADAPQPDVRQTQPVSVQAAETQRPRLPLTAAEASLIGPLTARPRARTIFGLRRR